MKNLLLAALALFFVSAEASAFTVKCRGAMRGTVTVERLSETSQEARITYNSSRSPWDYSRSFSGIAHLSSDGYKKPRENSSVDASIHYQVEGMMEDIGEQVSIQLTYSRASSEDNGWYLDKFTIGDYSYPSTRICDQLR